MESALRMRVQSNHIMHESAKFITEDEEDVAVDFSNAVLYVGALQTITATVFTAAISILACVAFPYNFVSAIRTLVLSSIVGIAIVRKPFRLGRVHGLRLIFRALQPCVLIYIGSEVAEQLVHTCTREASTPSWRRFVFHSMSVLMLLSGFLRARRPLAQTDLPFLIAVVALLVISMLPPPAVVLSGPLCSSPTLSSAAERIVRSFVFSLLYSVFVYAAAPPVQSSSEVLICVMRASAASIWVLAAHSYLLPFAIIQGSIAIYTRIFGQEYAIDDEEEAPLIMTQPVDYSQQPETFELEARHGHELHDAGLVEQAPDVQPKTVACADSLIVPSFQAIGARGLVDISSTAVGTFSGIALGGAARSRSGAVCSDLDMAAVAARIEAAEGLEPRGAASAV